MRWSSAVSDISSLTRAVDDTAERVEIGLDGRSADLVFAFISSHHAPSYYSVVELVRLLRLRWLQLQLMRKDERRWLH